MSAHRSLAAGFFALTLAVTASGEEASDPRVDLEAFGIALDRAVARVSRPVAGMWSSADSASRGYRLKGYGAVFVVPARALPSARRRAQEAEAVRALDQASRRLEEAVKRLDSAELRRRMEASLAALRATQAELRRGESRGETDSLPNVSGEDPSLDISAEVVALRREAELTQQAVEQSLVEIERQVRAQLPAPAAPAAPIAPAAPPAPEPPEPPALPPWSFWFEQDEADGRSAERVIRDVGEAVAQVIESHGPRLRQLEPEETIVVAVDFVPGSGRLLAGWGNPASPARAERTLVVRVRKRELEGRREGRLAPEELRKRIEYVEY